MRKKELGWLPLPMGLGDKSAAKCYQLVSDMMDTFSVLSKLQQMGLHWECEPSKEELREHKELIQEKETKIKDFVKGVCETFDYYPKRQSRRRRVM